MDERRAPARVADVARSALAACVLLWGGASCSLFDTRDAVPPTAPPPPECQFSDAVQPDVALRSLEQAFDCGTHGVSLMRLTHAPDFDFNAFALDGDVMPFVDAWEERPEPREGVVDAFSQHMSSLAAGETAVLTIDADTGDDVGSDDGRKFEDAPYQLQFFREGAIFSEFRGTADIFLRFEGNSYVIYQWDDAAGDEGFETIGVFWFGGTGAGESG